MINGIDHIVLGTTNLSSAATQFEKMGFTLSPRGDHKAYGSHNQCITLAQHYIELFAFYDRERYPDHPMLPLINAIGDGVFSIAWGSDDTAATRAALIERSGVELPPLNVQRRIMTADDGTVYDPEFSLTMLPPDMTLGLFSFVCRCHEPEKVWRAEWTNHANGITNLTGAAFICNTTQQLNETTQALGFFGAQGSTLNTKRGTLHVITREQAECAFSVAACEGLPAQPTIGALFLETRDFSLTQQWLKPHGARIINENIVLPAEAGGGCIWVITNE